MGSGCKKRPSCGTYERAPIATTPDGSSVGSCIAPNQEYLGGRVVVGTPNSVVSAVEARAVAVSERYAVATMSPWRFVNCSTGASPLLWTAARLPLMAGMLRVHSPELFCVQAGEAPGPE